MIKCTTVYVSVADIKIPNSFARKLPSASKIGDRIQFYQKHGCFDREILLDENDYLVDGYTVYLVCKMLGIDKIRAIRIKSLDMTANAYQKAALRTANTANPANLLLNGVMGLCGESGECIDIVKKNAFQGHKLNFEQLAKELGDVAWYLAVTAKAIGYDLETVLRMNVKKLQERYPDGFDAERSTHRQEGDV